MNGDIDFNKVPNWWAICPDGQCKMADSCLRHQVFLCAPHQVTRWLCVLPHALEDGKCAYFQKAERLMLARGFKKMFSEMKSRDARHDIRIALTDYFGSKGTYYRYKDGERWLSPEQQQWIVNLLAQYHIDGEGVFDEYEETYLFK